MIKYEISEGERAMIIVTLRYFVYLVATMEYGSEPTDDRRHVLQAERLIKVLSEKEMDEKQETE